MMTAKKSLWVRWKHLAQKAAEVQGHVLFFLLYVFAIIPMGLLNRSNRRALRGVGPQWREREPHPTDLTASRHQY
jgi:hypothetical protein